MRVEPHPHIGLQTVTWPLVGEIRHRDSLGSDADLRRGQLNLMTAGNGISHSEYSVGDGPVPLDALQFWVVLPESARHGDGGFERHTDLPTTTLPAATGSDATATVVLGEFAGVHSPATVHTPIVGAEIVVPAGTTVRLPLRPEWEHALLLVEGDAAVPEHAMTRNDMLYLGDSRDDVEVTSSEGGLLFLLGGTPADSGTPASTGTPRPPCLFSRHCLPSRATWPTRPNRHPRQFRHSRQHRHPPPSLPALTPLPALARDLADAPEQAPTPVQALPPVQAPTPVQASTPAQAPTPVQALPVLAPVPAVPLEPPGPTTPTPLFRHSRWLRLDGLSPA
ncbi:unnamed protein product [Penicillium discolor]